MSDKIDRFALRINGRDFPLNAAKATHDYECPSEITLDYPISDEMFLLMANTDTFAVGDGEAGE